MKTTSKGSCLVFFLYLHLLLIKTHGNTFSYENENLHIDKYVKDSQCITDGGKDIGVSCKFPFKYDIWDDVPYAPATIMRWPWFHKQMVFENCTSYRKSGSRPWCATKVTSNNRYISGHWGECPDTLGCNLVEGSWLPWSNWSEWSIFEGGRCTIPDVLPKLWGRKKQTRTRRQFSRKLETSGRNRNGLSEAQITEGSMKNTKMENIKNQMNTKLCHFPKCKACDDLGAATETRWGFRHEECNARCSEGIDEDTCKDVEFGNVGRNGDCYLNNDQNGKYKSQVLFDGRSKSSNSGGKQNADDNQIFRMDKDKSNNEFHDENHCVCFFLLHDI